MLRECVEGNVEILIYRWRVSNAASKPARCSDNERCRATRPWTEAEKLPETLRRKKQWAKTAETGRKKSQKSAVENEVPGQAKRKEHREGERGLMQKGRPEPSGG